MTAEHPDPAMIALGIRQPWAELILRGYKTIEVRTIPTKVRGAIYLYTSKRPESDPYAAEVSRRYELIKDKLPCGLLVGTVDIVECRPLSRSDLPAACLQSLKKERYFAWCLARPVRLERPLKVRFLPYGVWFYPFRRRKDSQGERRRRSAERRETARGNPDANSPESPAET